MEQYSSDDMEDDWFYESIRRYKTLQMFDLQYIPQHVIQMSNDSICVASKNTKFDNSELLELKLPAKLTLPLEDEGRSKGNDFKMMSGMYTQNRVFKINSISDSTKIITSEYERNGLQVYNLHGNESYSLLPNNLDQINWGTPNFIINQEMKCVLCFKCHHEPLVTVDLTTGKDVKVINHPFYTINILPVEAGAKSDPCGTNNIDCQFLDEKFLCILNTNTGYTVLYDLRTENTFVTLPEIEVKHSKQIWTLSSCDLRDSLNYFGILSNLSNFCIYDKRYLGKMLMNKNLEFPFGNYSYMRTKFSTSNRFSVSGFDSNVLIYNFEKENLENVFTHNGHTQKNHLDNSNYFVTDHIWLSSVGDYFLLSTCDNQTLNCWEYCETNASTTNKQ